VVLTDSTEGVVEDIQDCTLAVAAFLVGIQAAEDILEQGNLAVEVDSLVAADIPAEEDILVEADNTPVVEEATDLG
jgi:hypothetical protein